MSTSKNITIKEMIKNVVIKLGGKAKYSQIIELVRKNYGDINVGTIRAQTIACSVNQPSRIHFPENKKSRESDLVYDLFFSTGRGEVELFDSTKHGNWGIEEDKNGKYYITHEGKTVDNSEINEEGKHASEFLI